LFYRRFNLISVPDEINLTTCHNCGSIQKKGRWYDSNLTLEEQAVETIQEHEKVSQEVSNLEIVPELENIMVQP
jgi:NMD protein affecting ribosome stability and mRNA decay